MGSACSDSRHEAAMAKNIVIFSDGTGQEGGVRAEQRMSNIYKLYRACRVAPDTAIDPREQVAFYDPGLGTETSATGWTGRCAACKSSLRPFPGAASRPTSPTVTNSSSIITSRAIASFSSGSVAARTRCAVSATCSCFAACRPAGDAPLPQFRKADRDIAEKAVVHCAGARRGPPARNIRRRALRAGAALPREIRLRA